MVKLSITLKYCTPRLHLRFQKLSSLVWYQIQRLNISHQFLYCF